MSSADLFMQAGLVLIFAGIIIIMVAAILFIFRGIEKANEVSSGGIIFVGPFPIIFGTGKEYLKILALFAIVLFAVMIGLIIWFQILRM